MRYTLRWGLLLTVEDGQKNEGDEGSCVGQSVEAPALELTSRWILDFGQGPVPHHAVLDCDSVASQWEGGDGIRTLLARIKQATSPDKLRHRSSALFGIAPQNAYMVEAQGRQ